MPLLGTRAVFIETAAESSKEIYIISGAGRDRIFWLQIQIPHRDSKVESVLLSTHMGLISLLGL